MDTWKKWAIGAAVVVVAGAGTRAAGLWGGSQDSDKDTLNFTFPTPIQTLDISKNTDTYSGTVIGNTGSNLLRVNAKGKTVPDLAKSVKVSKDGLTYTATLRSGLKYSDGSTLTAKDFVYSWQRIVNPKTASQYSYLASGVKNAEAISAGKADVNSLGVKADGNKITFSLERPLPQFEYLLTFANFMPQKQSFVEKQGKKYGTTSEKQLYSGPYKFEGWNGTNNKFKMVKNDNYWDAKSVKTKEITWQVIQKPETAVQLYKQGKLDRTTISDTPELYKANKNNKDVVKQPEATTSYIEYNQTGKNKFLANTKIRQALNLATNRKELTDQVTSGISTPATGLAPQGLAKTSSGKDLAAYVAPGYKYDTKEAAKLFGEGLKEVGETKMSFTITTDSESPAGKTTLDYLKGSMEKALPGLTVDEKFVPFKQRLSDSQTQNFDAVVSLWGGDYPEGSTFYDLFRDGASYNNGQFKNSAYTQAVEKAETTDALNASARDSDYKAAEEALYKDANINPLYFRSRYALSRSNVKDIIINTTGTNMDLKYAYRK
ncbi:peptide ABC transporter substrate-binding protein [Leuconostoc mesenteroides]